MLNQVNMIGNLTADPELKYLPSGTGVCNFSVALNRKYKDKDGNYKEDVDYIAVQAWGKTAENCGEYLSKGSKVFINGRMKQQRWDDKDGKKHSKILVEVITVLFLDSKKGSSS